MLIFRFSLFLLLATHTIIPAVGQEKEVTFGFHIEPIIPNRMFRISNLTIKKEDVSFTFIPKTGYLFGSQIAIYFAHWFTVETGINIIKRGMEIKAEEQKNTFSVYTDFTIHNFEIPVTSTIYVKLTENIYIGHTAGISFQMLPSHLTSSEKWTDNNGKLSKFQQLSVRKYWLVPTFKGGVGFEYRTLEKGAIYLGAVYHLFSKMYNTEITYQTSSIDEYFTIKPQTDFFGILIRYYFPPSVLFKKKEKN